MTLVLSSTRPAWGRGIQDWLLGALVLEVQNGSLVRSFDAGHTTFAPFILLVCQNGRCELDDRSHIVIFSMSRDARSGLPCLLSLLAFFGRACAMADRGWAQAFTANSFANVCVRAILFV